VTGRLFSQSPPGSSTNKTDRHDTTEMLLKFGVKHHQTNEQTDKIVTSKMKRKLNSDDQQFHQYQQNENHFSSYLTGHKKNNDT
jgi:hypothetical protein